MPRGRGHRATLETIGTELNLVPYLDMLTVLVIFLLMTITSFLSFTMLTASIPQLSPDAPNTPVAPAQKEQLLLMVRVTSKGFYVDPNVQGGPPIKPVEIPKLADGKSYDFEGLTKFAATVKGRFKDETRVLIISEPMVVYDDIIHAMDSMRETKRGSADLFPDVTLSIF